VRGPVKLLTMPEDGLTPITTAIRRARTSVDMTIFRFDRADVEQAIAAAVAKGVRVRALVAHTNSDGERRLRKLEQRLLELGATLSRTADDLLRYHGKMLIIDGRTLYLMLFNYTGLDARSRSFAVVTRARGLVAEAVKLFEADATRQPYTAGTTPLVVSPETARKRLGEFLAGAKSELCIYDPKVSDPMMVRLLEAKARAGVDIRIIGGIGGRTKSLRALKLKPLRLHARVIISDGRHAFLGSQSLRSLELDDRREIGVTVKDPRVVSQLRDIFEGDWAASAPTSADAADEKEKEAEMATA
jgi:cardiolipin synthase A/B